MFHARFVVHQDIAVIGGQMIHGHGQVLVGGAVAARPVRLPHDQQIKAVFFDNSLLDFHFHELIAGHARRQVAFQVFPYAADGRADFEFQQFIQVGVGVGVHRQNRRQSSGQQIFDQQGRGGGLAGTTFSRHGDYFRGHGSFLPFSFHGLFPLPFSP